MKRLDEVEGFSDAMEKIRSRHHGWTIRLQTLVTFGGGMVWFECPPFSMSRAIFVENNPVAALFSAEADFVAKLENITLETLGEVVKESIPSLVPPPPPPCESQPDTTFTAGVKVSPVPPVAYNAKAVFPAKEKEEKPFVLEPIQEPPKKRWIEEAGKGIPPLPEDDDVL